LRDRAFHLFVFFSSNPIFKDIHMNPIPFAASPIVRLRSMLVAAAGAALLALPATNALAQTASSLKLQVNGMVCSFCAQGIEKRLKSLPDTGAIFIDLRNKVVAVESRAGQTLDAQRVATEVREAGYDVVGTETVPQTVAQIRAELRAAGKREQGR
jgi:copper chaperone CopZ